MGCVRSFAMTLIWSRSPTPPPGHRHSRTSPTAKSSELSVSVCLSLCVSLSVHSSVHPSISVPVCLSVCPLLDYPLCLLYMYMYMYMYM